MKVMGSSAVTLASGSPTLAVAGAVTIYTKAMCVKPAEFFGLSYLFSSATGSPDLKIEMQQSFQLPTTEGSSDTYWAEPENTNDIETSLTTETIRHKAINPVPLPYIRFKITGAAGNPADTTGLMWLTTWEE